MILQALNNLYDRLQADPTYEIPVPGYSNQQVSFIIVLNPDGSLHDIQDARTKTDEDRLRPRSVMVPGGAKKTGKGFDPRFLWGNMTYLLGYNPSRAKRAERAFREFLDLHLNAEKAIDLPEFSAVCRFLENWEPSDALRFQAKLDELGTDFGVFQIRGKTSFVHEDPVVRKYWESVLLANEDVQIGQCIATGEEAPIARTHPKIKGVYGAQSSGAAIVSFNEKAYESYGKSQSYNAPISEEVAFRYVAALNSLLRGPLRRKHSLLVGDTTVAFWTDSPTATEDVFLQFAAHGSHAVNQLESQDETLRNKVEAFLTALRKGKESYSQLEKAPESTSYFILGLGANAGRIAVRFFHRATLADLLENLRCHFSDIGIERQRAEESRNPDPEFPPIWILLRQTARDVSEIPPVLAGPVKSESVCKNGGLLGRLFGLR
jgi:CRISPR-associated protein Csd1